MKYLFEGAFETPVPLGAVVPLPVDDAESDIFIGWASHKADQARILFACFNRRLAALSSIFPFNAISRCLGLIDEIRIENIELVALNNFGRRVVVVVVCLIVFVPFISHLNPVEIPRLAGTILICPLRTRVGSDSFLCSEYLLILTDTSCELSLIQSSRSLREVFIRYGRESSRNSGNRCLSCNRLARRRD